MYLNVMSLVFNSGVYKEFIVIEQKTFAIIFFKKQDGSWGYDIYLIMKVDKILNKTAKMLTVFAWEFGLIADIFLLHYIFFHYFKVENQIRFHDEEKKRKADNFMSIFKWPVRNKDLSGQMDLLLPLVIYDPFCLD